MSHIDRDAPSVQLIESALFYHTDQDRPDYVPEPGMRSRRARLRQDHRRRERHRAGRRCCRDSRAATARRARSVSLSLQCALDEPRRAPFQHEPLHRSHGAGPRAGGGAPATVDGDARGRRQWLVGGAEPGSRSRSSAPRTTRTRSAAGRCCTCRASVYEDGSIRSIRTGRWRRAADATPTSRRCPRRRIWPSIATPGAQCDPAIDDCARRGVRTAIVMASGFGEMADSQAIAAQQRHGRAGAGPRACASSGPTRRGWRISGPAPSPASRRCSSRSSRPMARSASSARAA